MFGGIISGLDENKWMEVTEESKKPGPDVEFKEYRVNRGRKQLGDTTIGFLIAFEENEAFNVILRDTQKNTDPIKNVSHCFLAVRDETDEKGEAIKVVVGIDLDDDKVIRQDVAC